MAQSSDRNDSNSNGETGPTQAEQILDSIIEHIESTDEPVSGDKPIDPEKTQTEYFASDAHSDIETPQKKQIQEPDTVSDFKNIEKRAAELASRLGGAGLSYSKGMKKHLEPSIDSAEQVVQQDEPMIEAVIHHDDLDVDSDRFGVSDRDDSSKVELDVDVDVDVVNDDELVQQQLHVSEWNAELQEEQNQKSDSSLNSEKITVEMSASDQVIEHVEDQDNLSLLEPSTDHSPELQDIENNIEALSYSMNNQNDEPVSPAFVEPNDQLSEDSQMLDASIEDMDQRVSSLEKHIVQLLDDVALSEQKVGDTVTEIMRTETQKVVKDTMESSDVFGAMKAELATAGEQRLLQDTRMSDSLDALHDALKDIGERVKAIETGGAVLPQSAELDMRTSGSIVSSVLGVSLSDNEPSSTHDSSDMKSEMAEEVAEVIPSQSADEMPAWLSDSTQDLHGDQLDVPLESADVFASNPEPVIEPTIESSEEKAPVLTEQQDISQGTSASIEELHPMASEQQQITHSEFVEEEQNDDVKVEIVDCSSDQQQSDEGAEMTQDPPAGNDFLRSARAAARAANERAQTSELEEAAGKKGKMQEKMGNFIAAAKQKESGVEPEPIIESVKTSPKNSLFSDKVQGPNSLLVFTSLILFGTSALLLYGMSRDNVDGGSVVELNAVEKTIGQMPVGFDQGGDKNNQTKSNVKDKSNQGIGGSSKLETNIAVASASASASASAEKIANRNGADTLTVGDKLEASRMAEMAQSSSAIQYTGALNRVKTNVETGSLFDQYISFSAPSGPSPKMAGVKKLPSHNIGVGVLLDSASNGDAQAQYEVARRYGKGIGVQKSPAISVEWYEKSAKAGYAPAIYRLATMYERGNGVAKDYKRAMKLYITAAKKGNVKAMHNLAVLYTGGNLGKADYRNAIHWYSKAAQYGVKDSQFNLAIIYQNGMGGSLDLEKAFKWYSLAARAGDQEAKAMVVDLRKELSGKLQKKLDQKLLKWKPRTPDKSTNVVSQYRKASLQTSLDKKS